MKGILIFSVLVITTLMIGCGTRAEEKYEQIATVEIMGKLGIETKNLEFFETTVSIDPVDGAGLSNQKTITLCFRSTSPVDPLAGGAKTPYDRLGSCKTTEGAWYNGDGAIHAAVILLADNVARDLTNQVAKANPNVRPTVVGSPITTK